MKRELISVIVPVHNGEAYLENCIDSIAGQSYDNLEILIVNDGSTDRTGEICVRLQEKYRNIELFTLADVGVSAARNYALERANGAFLTFVDADDRLCPGTLSYLYERIQATDSDLAGCRFAVWSTEAQWEQALQKAAYEAKEVENAGTNEESMSGIEKECCYDRQLYLTNSILNDNCRCWSKLYRRRLVDKVRFREGLTVGEDMLFLIDILPYLDKAVETDYPGYGYYQNPDGVMRRPFTASYMDQIRCWEMAQDLILQMNDRLKPQTASKIITSVILTAGKIALCSAKERREAKAYLIQCRQKLKEQLQVAGSLNYLPGGYRSKVWLFCRLPGVYVRLYRGLQMAKNVAVLSRRGRRMG